MLRQFTASAFVIDSHKRMLLLWHRKHQKWLPPGGHIDPNELPEEAAARECKEETGLDVEIVGLLQDDIYKDNPSEGKMLKAPIALLLEEIPPHGDHPAHQHIDFVYLARPTDENQVLSLQEKESEDIRWFTGESIAAIPPSDIFANVKTQALQLLVQ